MARNSAPARRRAVRGAYPGHVRIIGGRWRSRRLPVPAAAGLRPTPDRVRETLFNWLAPYLPGARCLDLFAGTGALCLEALSRGARAVVMVERAPNAVAALARNIATLEASGAEVVALDAVEFLTRETVVPFDIVFLDPPFAAVDLIGRGAALLDERRWIAPGGLVYVEAPRALKSLPLPPGWELIRSKTAGQVGYHLARTPPGYT